MEDAEEKDLACRLAYEFILESMEEDQEFENLEFVNKDFPTTPSITYNFFIFIEYVYK